MASEPPFADRPDEEILDVVPCEPSDTRRAPETGITPVPPLTALDRDRPRPPLFGPLSPPQPGFWFGSLATIFMFVLCQLMIPLGVMIVYLVGLWIFSPSGRITLETIDTPEGQKQLTNQTAMLLLVSAHLPMILFGLLALRVVAGRHWWREVAIRLPSVSHLILLVLGFPALPILAGGVYMLAKEFVPGLAGAPALILSQLALIGVFGAFWLLGRGVRGHDPKKDLVRSSPTAQSLVGGGLLLVGVLVSAGVILLVSPLMPEMPPTIADLDKGMEELVQDARNWYLPLAVLVIAVMPAFSEEIWCRAFLGRGFIGQYGVVVGVMMASYFFGAIHILPHQGLMAMLMGLVLHYAYLTTRSLLAPMLLHFLNNATSVLGAWLGEETAKVDAAPDQIAISLYVSALVLLIAVGLALYQSRARLVRVGEPLFVPPWQPPYPGVALPPPGSGTAVSHPWPHPALAALALLAFAGFATVFTLLEMGVQLP
jgi:membrane protease YdiL (CAAX protease family)